MSSFSDRRGLPSCRKEEYCLARPRGRRAGFVATCRARLKGWIENVAARSPIWGDIDLRAFCKKTGYSREHATRELSKLRRRCGLAFETKLRAKRGGRSKAWGVIVADPGKLAFDKHSLFYDQHGRPLHNYTTLADDGEKIPPTIIITPVPRRRGRPRKQRCEEIAVKRPRGRPRKAVQQMSHESPKTLNPLVQKTPFDKSPKNARLCDNAKEEDSFGIQQKDSYGARRDVAQWRGREKENARPKRPSPLRRKAFAMLEKLAGCHWDNCKVTFSRQTAFKFALRSLNDGHEERRILACYADALFFCHGFAVDQAASTGKITFFNPSSTVLRAARLLAKDGLTRCARIAQWYGKRTEEAASGMTPETWQTSQRHFAGLTEDSQHNQPSSEVSCSLRS